MLFAAELRARYAADPASAELKALLRRDLDDFARKNALQVPHAASGIAASAVRMTHPSIHPM